LLLYGQELQNKVQARLGPNVEVGLAMRYGRPSIHSALQRFRERGVDRIVVFPLYPQYSSAATGSSLEKVFSEAGRLWNVPSIQVIPPFYDHPAFIFAATEAARPVIESANPEQVYFSFHGLPERQVKKSDDTGRHCLRSENCCAAIVEANRNCYRAQCYSTARLLGQALGLPEEQGTVCFQSRLGRTPWIRPFTDEVLAEKAAQGVRRAVILSPAFSADCLETIEELGIRGVDTWQENGGERLDVVPCVNASDTWADGLIQIASEHTTWLETCRAD